MATNGPPPQGPRISTPGLVDATTRNVVLAGSLWESLTAILLHFAVLSAHVLGFWLSIGVLVWRAFISFLLVQTRPGPQRVIVITGASSGIGEALAYEYARPGVYFSLIAKNEKRLQDVLATCRKKGAEGEIKPLDIAADTGRWLEAYLQDFDQRHPIDLLFANAGTTAYSEDDKVPLEEAWLDVLRTNVEGVIRTVGPVFARMKERNRGQIAITSSPASFYAPPNMIYYNASKAAIRSYARDLRYIGKAHNVLVSAITPGMVESRMTHPQAADQTSTVSRSNMLARSIAARTIKTGLARDEHIIGFPIGQYVFQFVLTTFPPTLQDLVTALFAASRQTGTRIQ